MYVAYHIFSNYTLFTTTLVLILTFPLWLYFAFFQTVGGLLCIGSSLLYLNRYLVDKTEATPFRYDPQRTRLDCSLEANAYVEEMSLAVTDSSDAENPQSIVTLRLDRADGNIHIGKAELHVGASIDSIRLQDQTSPDPFFLLQPVGEAESTESPDPLLSVAFLTFRSSDSLLLFLSSVEAVKRDDICQGKTTLQIALRPFAVDYYQPALVAAYRVLMCYNVVSDSLQDDAEAVHSIDSDSVNTASDAQNTASNSIQNTASNSAYDSSSDPVHDIDSDTGYATSDSLPSSQESEPSTDSIPLLGIQVDIASMSFVERSDDRSVIASLSVAPLKVLFHRNGHQSDIDVTGSSVAVVDDVSVGLHTPNLQVHVSSYLADSPFYPGFSSSILVRAPSLQGVLRFPFILTVIRTLFSGSLLSEMRGKEPDESTEASDYSQKPHMDIQVANPSILLASDATGKNGILLRSRNITLESGDRSIMFNTMMVTADGLTVLDDTPILHTSRLAICLRFCDTSTRVSITLDPSSLVLFPQSLTHLMAAISHSFKKSEPLATEDEECVLTEVSADDGDFTVNINPSFILDVTIRGITAYLESEVLSESSTIEGYMEEVRSNALVSVALSRSSCTYKTSPTDKSVEASIGVLSLTDSNAHSPCNDSYRRCATLGSGLEPFVKGQLAILDDGSKLFCNAHVGPIIFHLTPTLLSVPTTFMQYLPQKSGTEEVPVEPSPAPIVCR